MAAGAVVNFADHLPAKRRSTEGRLVYAIGDIHGSLRLLEELLLEISRDAIETAPSYRPMVIFVGDYLDRGRSSAGVIDLILALRAAGVFEVRTLKGNHEEAMLTFLADPNFGPTWVHFGGAETLVSYGVDPPQETSGPDEWERVQRELLKALPPAHRDFLDSLELLIRVGDYAFAHAGIAPGEPLERQQEQDLLWIRGEFLSHRGKTDVMVVHGHTPSLAPEFLCHRFGIDTGAYATGLLTCLRLFEGAESLIQAQQEISWATF